MGAWTFGAVVTLKRELSWFTEQHGEIGIRSIRFYVKYMCELAPRITM
jgi:hypothetical protein